MFRIILARYRFRKFSSWLAALALLSGVGRAQGEALPAALPEDLLPELKQLLQTASTQSPAIVAKNIDVAQAEALRIQDRAGLFPTLSASGGYSNVESAIAGEAGSKSSNDGVFYGVYFSQPLFHWGALKHQHDIGKIGVQLAEKSYAEAYRTLTLTIRKQYLALIQSKMEVRNREFAARAAESFLGLQEAKLRDGRLSQGEIIHPRLALEEARIRAGRAQAEYESAKRLLARTVGVPDIDDSTVPSSIPRPTYAPQTLGAYFETLKNTSLENTFMGDYYRQSIEQAQMRYRIARVRLLPKFSLSASYNQSNYSQIERLATGDRVVQTELTSTVYGITGFWTLFDGLATRGAKLSALAAKRLAERSLDTYLESTSESIRLLEKQIGFSGRMMDLTDTRRQLAFAAVKKVSDDVRSGVSPQATLDKFTAEAYDSELASLSAQAEFLSHWSEYVSLLGVDPVLANISPRYLRHGK